MPLLTDKHYLQQDQYRDSAKLSARAYVHKQYSTNPYSWPRWVFDQLELQSGQRVLEVGGGPGYLWRENADRMPPRLTLIFSDFSMGMVREARRVLAGQTGTAGLSFDAQAIPLPAAAFDTAVANHMLYHVPDIAQGVRELARVLRPGGRLFAATNGLGHMAELHALLREFDPRYEGRASPAERFGLENAAEVLSAGFARAEVRLYQSPLWVTEARPLADYVASMWDVGGLDDARRASELEAFFQSKIAAAGGMAINREVGLAVGYPA